MIQFQFNIIHGDNNVDTVMSPKVETLDKLKDSLCDFLDNGVVIQFNDGQEHLDDMLDELGLPRGLLIAEYNEECTVNRELFDMSKCGDYLHRLRRGFEDHVTEDWEVKFKVLTHT